MILFDKLSYSSPVRQTSPALKSLFAVGSLVICVSFRQVSVCVLVLCCMAACTLQFANVTPRRYLRFLLGPLVFLALSSVAVLFFVSSSPQELFSFRLFSRYIGISRLSFSNWYSLMAVAFSGVSCLYFLILTTPVTDLLAVLRRLHCPWLLLELMLLADVGMLGMPNAGKSTFIRAVSAAKPKVADYPFTTLVPSLGVVRMDNEKSFVVADIPGLIEGAAEGAGLGIRFLKHLERCRVLLHLIDIDPIDGTDPVENARIIISELEKYSQDLAAKPRWLVFNKIDLLDKAEAEEKAKAIAEALGWEDKYYLISAASGLGVKDLCWDVMTFIIENPVVQAEEAKQPEKVEFMWDDYHRQQLEEIAEEDDEDWDDDWDEDDEEGVEFIYKR